MQAVKKSQEFKSKNQSPLSKSPPPEKSNKTGVQSPKPMADQSPKLLKKDPFDKKGSVSPKIISNKLAEKDKKGSLEFPGGDAKKAGAVKKELSKIEEAKKPVPPKEPLKGGKGSPKKKAFLTNHDEDLEESQALEVYAPKYTMHDILIPGGMPAKLTKIQNSQDRNLRIGEILDRYKFRNSNPVIILSGAWGSNMSKVLVGVCRAAFHTGAYIIDSGVRSGIEKFCIRKNVKLMGVAPENEILYPKVNPTERFDHELANGHSHFFLLEDKKRWGEEYLFKTQLAERLSKGKYNEYPCRVVVIAIGENPHCSYENEIEFCADKKWPVVVVKGSKHNEKLVSYAEKKEADSSLIRSERLKKLLDDGKIFMINNSSEDIASITHMALSMDILAYKNGYSVENNEQSHLHGGTHKQMKKLESGIKSPIPQKPGYKK